jgi:iron complex outermembrane recepter protein
VVYSAGTNPVGFRAQSSENWSFGLEFASESVEGLHVGLNYFDIEYSDQIAAPANGDPFAVLNNPETFREVTILQPTVAQVEAAIAAVANAPQGFLVFDEDFNEVALADFDRSAIDIIMDVRRRNLSRVDTRGLDFTADYGFDASAGSFQLALTATYLFNRTQRVTSTSPSFDSLDTIYNPPDLRIRGSLGWNDGAWSSNVFVNHTASYIDNRVPSALREVSSYQTVDANLSYDFNERFSSGLLSGVTLSFNVQDLFDTDPPRTAVLYAPSDMGFDPTNASPLGRLVSIGIAKIW